VAKKPHKAKTKAEEEAPSPIADAKPCVFFCGNPAQ